VKHWLKVGGWYIPLEDMKEENLHPWTRKLAYWLFVAGVGIAFYLIICFGGR